MTRFQLWSGRALSAFAVLFLLFDVTLHLLRPPFVIEGTKQVGFPVNAILTLGIIELVCLILYVFPRTAVLGAILWTGYLGGAVATHVRAGDPLFSHILFPTYVALFLWGGLWLRDQRLRALVPVR
jgi:hypothetical protein